MNAIGPGDILECVDASPFEGEPVPLVAGERYVVLRVWPYLPHAGNPDAGWYDCGVDLVDVDPPRPNLTWGLYRFRPIGPGEPLATSRQSEVEALEPAA